MGPDARDPQGIGDLFQVPGSQYVDPKFSWLDTVGPRNQSSCRGGQHRKQK